MEQFDDLRHDPNDYIWLDERFIPKKGYRFCVLCGVNKTKYIGSCFWCSHQRLTYVNPHLPDRNDIICYRKEMSDKGTVFIFYV